MCFSVLPALFVLAGTIRRMDTDGRISCEEQGANTIFDGSRKRG